MAYMTKPETWGSFTFMGNQHQQNIEEHFRWKVSQLRGDIQATDFVSVVVKHIGRNPVYTDDDITVIEAALDGCSQEDIAMFIYILLAGRNR